MFIPVSSLIEDLKMLCEESLEVFDAHSHDFFKMITMLFYTIHDFLAYRNLSDIVLRDIVLRNMKHVLYVNNALA